MSVDFATASVQPETISPFERQLRHEMQHLRRHWWCFTLLGALLALCGTAAVIVPAVTVGTTFAVAILLGALMMVGGVATIVGAFWAGKWSGLLVQLLVGLLYLACGFVATENPEAMAQVMTVFIAATFVVLGVFRTVAALMVRFPQWGWALLNGVVTLLAGTIIYRHLPFDAFWVLGLLVGIEMLFNGWTWIMLSMALRAMNEPATR